MLTLTEKSDLQAIKAIVPVQQLFNSRQEAHDAMMAVVGETLRESRELGCFPDEAFFVETLKEVWLNLYSQYAPSEPKAAA